MPTSRIPPDPPQGASPAHQITLGDRGIAREARLRVLRAGILLPMAGLQADQWLVRLLSLEPKLSTITLMQRNAVSGALEATRVQACRQRRLDQLANSRVMRPDLSPKRTPRDQIESCASALLPRTISRRSAIQTAKGVLRSRMMRSYHRHKSRHWDMRIQDFLNLPTNATHSYTRMAQITSHHLVQSRL